MSKTQTGGGSNIGTNITVFSKTAVLSDIGANVTVSGVSGSWPWSLHARTYTTTGVDQTATAGVAGPSSGGSTLNPPVLTTSAKNEAIVTFFGGIAQTSGMTGVTIASGGSNVVTTKNASGFEFEFGEDWTLTAAGGTSTGGAVTDTRAFPTLVAISVSLLHS